MGLVRTLTGQVARAAGATLIAPLALLMAAGVMATGGGLSGLGSLREIASGPSLPSSGVEVPPTSTLAPADVVDVSRAQGAAAARPAPASGPTAPASLPTPSPAAKGAPAASAPITRRPAPTPFKLKGPPGNTGRGPAGGEPGPTGERPTLAPVPVEELLETTRGLGDSLRKPLEPVTNGILDLLLGPPPR